MADNGMLAFANAVFGQTSLTDQGTVLDQAFRRLALGISSISSTGVITWAQPHSRKANVISGSGATASLTAAQSGSIVLFDRAAGIVFTLPAPVVGLYYDFIVTTTITSNNAEIDTDAGTTFVLGNVNAQIDATATDKAFFGNGSSHVKVQMNGTTTGGIKGTQIRVVCVSSTVWNVTGMLAASGTLATPFA